MRPRLISIRSATWVQNGVQVTNNPNRPALQGSTINTSAMGCADQINSKTLSYIQTVYPRRPVVVDEERQLVFGFFMFQQIPE
jgi:hypothetical protein